MTKEEMRASIKIDPMQLDVEAAMQAENFLAIAEDCIEAKAKIDRLEYDLDLLEAKTQMRIREEPAKYGIEKVTEGAISATVKLNDKVIEASEAVMDARKEHMLLQHTLMASEQRKRMLEILVTLHGQQYFAGPSVPRDLVSAFQEYQEKRGPAGVERQKAAARKRVQNT